MSRGRGVCMRMRYRLVAMGRGAKGAMYWVTGVKGGWRPRRRKKVAQQRLGLDEQGGAGGRTNGRRHGVIGHGANVTNPKLVVVQWQSVQKSQRKTKMKLRSREKDPGAGGARTCRRHAQQSRLNHTV